MKKDYESELFELYRQKNSECVKLRKEAELCIAVCAVLLVPVRFLSVSSSEYPSFIPLLVIDAAFSVALIVCAVRKLKKIRSVATEYNIKSRELSKESYAQSNGLISVPAELNTKYFDTAFIVALIVVTVAVYAAFGKLTSFSLDRWVNSKSSRIFMLDDFSYSQRAVSYDETHGDREKYPNLLRSYSRQELDAFFQTDEKTNDGDVKILYSDGFNGNLISDVYYCCSDWFGKDYWILIIYNIESGKAEYAYAQAVVSGTTVTLKENSFEINK